MPTTHQKNDKNKKSQSLVRNVLFCILQSIPQRAFAVVSIYALGYYNINPFWFFIIWVFFKYRDQKRLERRFRQEAATAIALRNRRLLVLNNVDSLPSWVHYTDTERCEWVNDVIHQMWNTLKTVLIQKLDKLEEDINKSSLSCKFDIVNVGSLTPRITGIRVYGKDTLDATRTIMDLHLFYVSDGEFSCSVMDYVSLGGSELDIEGRLRVVISTPDSSSMPGVEVFFLGPPKLDFTLSGVATIADMPVIKGQVRGAIDKYITDRFVVPNRYILTYNKNIDYDALKFPEPEGLLKVVVIEAKDLGRTPSLGEKLHYSSTANPDPFATITFGSKTFKTPSVKNTIDPVWNFTAEFLVDSIFDAVATISVEDEKNAKPLGEITFGLKMVEEKVEFKSWLQLEDVVSGMVHLCVSCHKLEVYPKLKYSKDLPAILEFFIDEAKRLPNIKGDIVAEVSVKKSKLLSRSVPVGNPVFREKFVFHVKTPINDKILIKLINNEEPLGSAEFFIEQLLKAKNVEVINEKIKIKGANNTYELSVSMRLRTLKSK